MSDNYDNTEDLKRIGNAGIAFQRKEKLDRFTENLVNFDVKILDLNILR